MANVGDIGVVFTGTVKDGGSVVDLTGLSSADMTFNPPGGALKTKTGVSVPTPTNGEVKYTTVSGDLDVPGAWTVQVKVLLAVGSQEFYSKLHTFRVGPQLA